MATLGLLFHVICHDAIQLSGQVVQFVSIGRWQDTEKRQDVLENSQKKSTTVTFLSWNDMQMRVWNRLPCGPSIVPHEIGTVAGKIILGVVVSFTIGRQGHGHEMGETHHVHGHFQRHLFVHDIGVVLLGNDQRVSWTNGMNVQKDGTGVIFVHATSFQFVG